MATVAQTIGNGGMRMEPRLVAKVLDPDGRTIDEPLPEEAERVMSEDTAEKVGDMMRNVVKEGTGTAAALEGVEVAGKTGTAEVNLQGLNDAVVHRLHRPVRGRGRDRARAGRDGRRGRRADRQADVLESLGED